MNFSQEIKKLLTVAYLGPIAVFPACILLEVVLESFRIPLVPFVNGYLFGTGDFTGVLKFAFLILAFAFYPIAFLVGLPVALILRHFRKPGIGGMIATPLLAAFIFSIMPGHPDLKIVVFICSIVVATGCWWIYKRAQHSHS